MAGRWQGAVRPAGGIRQRRALFSDKDCAFRSDIDVTVAPRAGIEVLLKVGQAAHGAEKFLKSHLKRVFPGTRAAKLLCPLSFPDLRVARYYLIAVTRGALPGKAVLRRGQPGSVMLLTHLVGRPTTRRRRSMLAFRSRAVVSFMLDEMTVDVLLDELDTVPDLVNHLRKKEGVPCSDPTPSSVPGEEELLALHVHDA